MSGQYRLTVEELTHFAGRIETVNGAIQSELRRLDGVVGAIASGWHGDAARTYQQLQRRWNDNAQALNRVLNEIRDVLNANQRGYQNAEDEQRTRLNGIAAALG